MNCLQRIKSWRKKSKPVLEEAKDLGKEVAVAISSNSPANIQENKKTLFELITQYYKGELSKEAIIGNLRTGFILLSCATKDEQDEVMKCILDTELDIKKDRITNDEYDTYHKIISYIHNNRQEKIKALLRKAAQRVGDEQLPISKETVDFIISITDSQLEVIQEMFRYVVGNGVLKYKDITSDFGVRNFNQSGSDNIKFLGKIFYNQDVVGGKSYSIKVEAVSIEGILIWKCLIPTIRLNNIPVTEESLKKYLEVEQNRKGFVEYLEKLPIKIEVFNKGKVKFYISKQPTSAGEIKLDINCFTILTDVGVELYSLLEDEIRDYPDGYLQSVVDSEQYKAFGLKFKTD